MDTTRSGLLVALLLVLPATARSAVVDGASNTFLAGEAFPGTPIPVELVEPGDGAAEGWGEWEILWAELESRGGGGRAVIWIKVRSLAAFPALAAAVESRRPLPEAALVREERGVRTTIHVRSFQIISAGKDSRFGPQTLRIEGEFRLASGPPGAAGRTSDEKWIELISHPASHPPLKVTVVAGDLPARLAGGQPRGQGEVHLEGHQALVFFLGGIPAPEQPIPEIRGRTAEGKAFVLRGVRVETLESAGGSARAHLLYQDLVIP
jgi:hypothetical protein